MATSDDGSSVAPAAAPDTALGASAPAFGDLPLHGDVARALAAMRFRSPSPIQLRALPVALFGNDVIGQAKSGTGKTAVFGVTAVEHAIRHVERQQQSNGVASESTAGHPVALILAPTREIAVQIEVVLRQISQFRPECVICTFIGGLPVAQDQMHLAAGCHLVVGTPGRIRALVDQHTLYCGSIRLLVLDEVDKLMARDFQDDIQYIVSALPERRQTLAFSATFTPDQLVAVAELMRTPQVDNSIVRVRGPNDVTTEFISSAEELADWKKREQVNSPELWLRHVRQFYSVVQSPPTSASRSDALNMRSKVAKLAALLSEIVFAQCMVFCNDKFRAEALATALTAQGWPAACITGSQTQATRLEVMDSFRASRSRVLVSTDLMARGIDVDRVNFVVNLDLPRDPATYLHRVGRTGRFGGKGLAVTLLSPGEVAGIQLLARVFKMQVDKLPSPIPREIFTYAAVEEVAGSLGQNEEERRSADAGADLAEMLHEDGSVTPETDVEGIAIATGGEERREQILDMEQLSSAQRSPEVSDAEKSMPSEEGSVGLESKSDGSWSRYAAEERGYELWLTML